MSKNVPIHVETPISISVTETNVPYSEVAISDALYLADDSADPTSSTLLTNALLDDLDFNTEAVVVEWTYNQLTPVLGLGYADSITAWDLGDLASQPALIDGTKNANGQQALWYEVLGVDMGVSKRVKKFIIYDWNSPAGSAGGLHANWDTLKLYTSDDNATWTYQESILCTRSSGGPATVGTIICELSKEYTSRYFALYSDGVPLKDAATQSLLYSYSEVEVYEGVPKKWSVGVDLGAGGQLANQIEIYDYTTTGGEGLDWSGINGSLALYQSADNATWTYVETFLAMSRQEHIDGSYVYIIAMKFNTAITNRYFKLYCTAGALRTATLIPVVPSEIRVFTVPDTLTEEIDEYTTYSVEATASGATKRVL